MAIGEVMENQTVDIEFFVEGILDKDITVTVYIVEGKYSMDVDDYDAILYCREVLVCVIIMPNYILCIV